MHANFDIPTAPPLNVRNQASTTAYRPYLEQIAPESSLGQNAQATNIGMSNASARFVHIPLI